MFYCHKWLSTNGKLHDPWAAATFCGSTTSTESTSSVESDLRHICNDLSEVFNSNSKKKEHRISLRLASHLIYGTCLIHQKKALELLNDCSYAFVQNNPSLINQRINLSLYKIPDSEVDSVQESIESCLSTMFPTDQELQDADIYTGHTSSNLNPIFEDERIEAVRNAQKDSLSIHSPKTIDGDFSESGESTQSHFAKNQLPKQQMIGDEANRNTITDVLQIYNCEYSLPSTTVGHIESRDTVIPHKSPLTPPTNNKAPHKTHEKSRLQLKSVKIHDTYKNFIEDFTLENCTDWKHKSKRKRKVVDRFKQLRSKHVRLQRNNLMCHLRCQTPSDDKVDIRKESSKRLMNPTRSHSNSKMLNSMYHRNLLTRQKSIDKDIFYCVLSPPGALRQKQYPSELISVDSNVYVISDDTISNSPAPMPFFDKSNQKEISENSSNNHNQMTYITMKKKCDTRNSSNASLRNISQRQMSNVDIENENDSRNSSNTSLRNISRRQMSNMDSENENDTRNSSNASLRNISQRQMSNMDSEHEHNNQSVYILFPKNQKNEVKIEELKMFIGSSSSKRKILNEFFNQQNPRANFSSTSNLHLKNSKAISAKRSSTFNRILEKSLISSDEWNEYGVFEKLNKLWSYNNKVSFEMLLEEAPMGVNPASTMAKTFNSLMNLKRSHFVQILKNYEGEIEFILKGPASWMRTTYHPYSM